MTEIVQSLLLAITSFLLGYRWSNKREIVEQKMGLELNPTYGIGLSKKTGKLQPKKGGVVQAKQPAQFGEPGQVVKVQPKILRMVKDVEEESGS